MSLEHDTSTTPECISTVALKLPPFWPSDPQLWFAQVEAQFQLRGISAERTKFDHVIASLSPESASEVRDLILSPPSSQPYDELRRQLIQRTSQSERRRLQTLLGTHDFGDLTPTRLLRKMRQLQGDAAENADGPLFRELFLQRLPVNIRVVLASLDSSLSLEELAERADRMAETGSFSTTTSTVASVSGTQDGEINRLRADMADLKKLFQTFTTSSPGGKPKKVKKVSKTEPEPPLCWYHLRFGMAAQKCKPPCSWAGNYRAGH